MTNQPPAARALARAHARTPTSCFALSLTHFPPPSCPHTQHTQQAIRKASQIARLVGAPTFAGARWWLSLDDDQRAELPEGLVKLGQEKKAQVRVKVKRAGDKAAGPKRKRGRGAAAGRRGRQVARGEDAEDAATTATSETTPPGGSQEVADV